MTREEYDDLYDEPIVPTVSVSDLTDTSDRTLLWGYDVERRSWHVFLRAKMIELYVYVGWRLQEPFQMRDDHMVDDTFPAELLVPNKRLYPEACDAEFCRLLLRAGVTLPFTTWDERRRPRQFHGEVPDPIPA